MEQTQDIFKAWKTSRQLLLKLLENYTADQVNTIPNGFRNNLIWNAGHILVAQQSLVYKGSDLPLKISDEMVEKYKAGTVATGDASEQEIEEIKTLLNDLIISTETDFKNGVFRTYNERTTATGFHLSSVHDALLFNNYHEGLHLGIMMSIRKFI